MYNCVRLGLKLTKAASVLISVTPALQILKLMFAIVSFNPEDASSAVTNITTDVAIVNFNPGDTVCIYAWGPRMLRRRLPLPPHPAQRHNTLGWPRAARGRGHPPAARGAFRHSAVAHHRNRHHMRME